MKLIDPQAPSDEVLSAVNLAATWMGGIRDPFQTWCAGFAAGIGAELDCLGADIKFYHPSVLGDDEANVNHKLLAGAVSLIEQYNMAVEKDSSAEELNPKMIEARTAFRDRAHKAYADFMAKTKKEN